MNSASISGRLTKDIELRHTQNGVPVCSFSVAVYRPGVKDTTDFLDCVAWRKSAEFASKYFHKGDPIELTGTITTRNYEDKNGNKRKAVEIVCDHISFPKQKKRDDSDGYDSYGSNSPEGDSYQEPDFKELDDDGDLPF